MYEFPRIEHIDDVKDVITRQKKKEFIIVNKGEYTVINYAYQDRDTFTTPCPRDSAILRECRGIIFDSDTGIILSRPFHKFFNINEKPEVSESNISKAMSDNGYRILEKLDGSMIRPIHMGDGIRLATKMGITEIAMQAEEFISDKKNYGDFLNFCFQSSVTPLFEWCSKQNRVVIDHEEPKLILTAMRLNFSGQYISYNKMTKQANIWNIPYVNEMYFDNWQDVYDVQYQEGIVLRFDNGHMAKVKSDWYCQIHRVVGDLNNERAFIRLMFHGDTDDVHSKLQDEKLQQYEVDFREAYLKARDLTVDTFYHAWESSRGDRKYFALNTAPKLHPYMRQIIFTSWDKWQDTAVCAVFDDWAKRIVSVKDKVMLFKEYIAPELKYPRGGE